MTLHAYVAYCKACCMYVALLLHIAYLVDCWGDFLWQANATL
uniref:Uncharacterized protein n=1 Tax=Anguilla anguilla TaxID=7936 RepID=A0A0E9SY42_ANGAN